MALGSHTAARGALSPEVSPTWGLSTGAGSERGLPHTLHTATGTLFVSRLPRAARCQFLSGRGKQGQGADLTSTPAREQSCVPRTPPPTVPVGPSPRRQQWTRTPHTRWASWGRAGHMACPLGARVLGAAGGGEGSSDTSRFLR